jgi:hypothetical protein
MTKRDNELAKQAGLDLIHSNFMTGAQEEFAKLIRADERARMEKAVRELAPLKDIALLQAKPAAFWIDAFAKIVRGNP